MAISLKHTKNVAKADGTDSTVVQPSDWNAEHTLTAAPGKVLGTTAGSTSVSELPLSIDATGQSVIPPSGTTLGRPAPASAGMFRFNTTTGLLEYYSGSAWQGVDAFPSGTRMLFQQTNAPTGWTKDTSQNDKALRVVSGTAGSGGSVAFSSAFSNQNTGSTSAGGTVAGTALSEAQIPAHRHYIAANTSTGQSFVANAAVRSVYDGTTNLDYSLRSANNGVEANAGLSSAIGGSQAHSHGFTGDWHSHTINLAVQYVDTIIATKN